MAGLAVRIAIVDDDASVRRALTRLLAASSYATSAYASAAEFIVSLQFSLPECLIVDLHMPGMSGLDLHLHLSSTGVRIPTIIVTAHHDEASRKKCEA